MKMNPQRRSRHTFFIYTLMLVIPLLPFTGGLQPAFAQVGSITFSLFPISASGEYIIIGNQIFLKHNDQRIYLEFFASDWAPDLLIVFQFVIDAADSYFDGIKFSLLPAVVSCMDNADCETILGSGSRCTKPPDPPNWSGLDTCRAGYINENRSDEFVDETGIISPYGIIGASTTQRNFVYGRSILSGEFGKKDFGDHYYVGTLVLDASTDAVGEYTINHQPGNAAARNSFSEHLAVNYIPPVITVCNVEPEPQQCNEVLGACCDGLTTSCKDNEFQFECDDTLLTWTSGAQCNEIMCDPLLGACCNTRLGTCTSNLSVSQCSGDHLVWIKGELCNEQNCVDPFVPAVSEWGLLILALIIMIAAKTSFSGTISNNTPSDR